MGALEDLDSAFVTAEELGRAGRWQQVKLALTPFRAEISGHAKASFLLAFAYVALRDMVPARDLALRSLKSAEEAGDLERKMKCANLLGIISFETGDLAAAEHHFTDALALAETCRSDKIAGMVANNLGNICGIHGDLERAIGYYETALAVHRRTGDRYPEAQALNNLAIAHRDLCDWEKAESYFAQAASASEECKEPRLFASAVAGRADLRIRHGRLDEAERMARAALLRFDVQSDTSGLAEVYKILGIVARKREDLAAASEYLERALDYCGLHDNPLITAEIRLERGLLLRQVGEEHHAREELSAAASLFEQMHATHHAEIARAHLAGAH